MDDSNIIKLSILVITHNQEKLLSRCINSLLEQNMNFQYEIIIGDDNSTDGTWEIVQKYKNKFPNLIFCYQINSDICNPTLLSERSGYNRTVAYSMSRGVYFAEVDGDDFLIGDDVYQKQVDMLDLHPECSLCMQNLLCIRDGDEIENGKLWFEKGKFYTGQIVSAENYILEHLFIQHQAFIYRKNANENPVTILGKHYEDTTITLYHLQFGNIIYIDKSDYVCVRYQESINSSLVGDDRLVTFCLLPLRHIFYIPKFSGLFIKSGLSDLIHLAKKCSQRQLKLKEETKRFFSQFEGFIYDYFQKEKLGIYYKARFLITRILVLSIKKWSLDYPFIYRFTYALLTNNKEMSGILKENWEIN